MPQTISMPPDLRWQSAQTAAMGISNNLLMPLVLGKIQHNMQMERADRALEGEKILADKRAREERSQINLKASAKGTQDRLTADHRAGLVPKTGAYKIGQLQDFKIGDKIVKGIYTGGIGDPSLAPGWHKAGAVADRYKTGTTVNVTNKVLPATEVSKLGEYEAYAKTMDEIDLLIRTGKGDHTGPFEFISKRLDNWGVMPNAERIEMRALVARLPGLMYAMRGKQLSDKELQVALDMMPRMDMDEKAFAIQLRKFNEYMNTVIQGKLDAFKGAGYKTGNVGERKTAQGDRPPIDSFHF